MFTPTHMCVYDHKHMHTCIGSTYILAFFFFLPLSLSHLHGVRVTPEQGRKPCGRIRKWSIFWEHKRSRSRAAYVGIWIANRWITQSGVFFFSLCRLAGIVQRYLSLCERKIERDGGIGGVGIHPSPKYYVVVKNICNARRYFGKYLKKANTRLTFSWAFVNRFTLHIIWRRVREDLCYCVMLFLPNYVNLFRSYIHFYISR